MGTEDLNRLIRRGMLRLMPKETDEGRLRILREIFASRASNEPYFTETAKYGGYRKDEGVQALLQGDDSVTQKMARLKSFIVRFMDQRGLPNRIIETGDSAMKLDFRNPI